MGSLADNAGTGEDESHDFPTTSSGESPLSRREWRAGNPGQLPLIVNTMQAIEINRPYLRNREKIKLSAMLTMMQVTIGK